MDFIFVRWMGNIDEWMDGYVYIYMYVGKEERRKGGSWEVGFSHAVLCYAMLCYAMRFVTLGLLLLGFEV